MPTVEMNDDETLRKTILRPPESGDYAWSDDVGRTPAEEASSEESSRRGSTSSDRAISDELARQRGDLRNLQENVAHRYSQLQDELKKSEARIAKLISQRNARTRIEVFVVLMTLFVLVVALQYQSIKDQTEKNVIEFDAVNAKLKDLSKIFDGELKNYMDKVKLTELVMGEAGKLNEKEFQSINKKVEDLNKATSDLQTSVGGVKNNMKTLKQETQTIGTTIGEAGKLNEKEFQSINKKFNDLKKTTSDLQTSVENIKKNVKNLKKETKTIETTIDGVEKEKNNEIKQINKKTEDVSNRVTNIVEKTLPNYLLNFDDKLEKYMDFGRNVILAIFVTTVVGLLLFACCYQPPQRGGEFRLRIGN